MNKQWLKDLPELVREQVITQETADHITHYYHRNNGTPSNRLGIVLGILGALLVGSGLTLIVAHNWDDFTRPVKTILSFAPLLITQLLCGYALLKQRENALWRECSCVLLFFAIGTSISLIGQVYHVDGTLSQFLLTWTLLSLPLVYLLSSSCVALLCMATITWYAANIGYFQRPDHIPYLYLPIMAAILPYIYLVFKNRRESHFNFILHVFLSLSLVIVLGTFTLKSWQHHEFISLLYLLLCCLYYCIGHIPSLKERSAVTRPYYFEGVIGMLFILFMWSFDWAWSGGILIGANHFSVIPIVILTTAGIGMLGTFARNNFETFSAALLHPLFISFAVLSLSILLFRNKQEIGLVIVNCWLLIIASWYIKRGTDENHFGILNFGLLIIGTLAVCRFFDDSIPFVWRGIFFLLAGVGFFAANLLLLRRRKTPLKQPS